MTRTWRVVGVLFGLLAVVIAVVVLVQVRPSMPDDEAGALSFSPSPPPQGSLPPTPSPSLDETAAPNEHGLSCGTHITDVALNADFLDVEYLSDYSSAVVTGKLVSVGKGQWATADGMPPTDEYGSPPTALQVFRLIEVSLANVAKRPGNDSRFRPESSISARALGGAIGCLTFRLSSDLELNPGDEVALFLGDQPGLGLAPAADMDVIDAWPIIDGIVHGRLADLTIEEFLSIASQ